MGGFRGVFALKSGLRILIRAPEVPFSVPPKTPKMGHLGVFLTILGLPKKELQVTIEAEKKYPHGKERSQSKNKNSFENLEASGKTKEHAK